MKEEWETRAPLTPMDCDCTDLDGFMLNVEHLMASELVALSDNREVGAALFLWSRAWKQIPAASLPDDDRVLASFSRLPVKQFQAVRANVMRGFVKCSDGRLYHRFLAREAIKAYERKIAFRNKQQGDAERLRKWRSKRRGNDGETQNETLNETHDETRFTPIAETLTDAVSYGKDRDRDRDRDKEKKEKEDRHQRAREVLTRVCEILEVRLTDDPERLTWGRQMEAMLSDGLAETEIIKAAHIARNNGKTKLSYVRAVALNTGKEGIHEPRNTDGRSTARGAGRGIFEAAHAALDAIRKDAGGRGEPDGGNSSGGRATVLLGPADIGQNPSDGGGHYPGTREAGPRLPVAETIPGRTDGEKFGVSRGPLVPDGGGGEGGLCGLAAVAPVGGGGPLLPEPRADTRAGKAMRWGPADGPLAQGERALRAKIGDQMFDAWLGNCTAVEAGANVIITAPTRTVRDCVANRYLVCVEKAFAPAAVFLLLKEDDLTLPACLVRTGTKLGEEAA